MALVIADRVRETSTTTGTGTLTLAGAVSGFQTFSSAIGDANTCYYTIVNGSEWEVGLGTVAAGTLARTTILQSSNADAAVNFSAGTKDVFATYPADKSVFKDASNNVNALGTVSSGVWNGSEITVPYGGTGVATLTGIVKGNGQSAFSAATAGTDYVTPTGTETLTNKTLTNPTVTNYVETPFTANSSTAITLALTNGTVQIITLTGNATITMPTAVSGKSFLLMLKQDGTGSRTVTWSTVKWPGGTAPTITATASKQDIYSFFSDGTNWYGATISQNYTP
tara:strand:- start:135 stop:980 length:846 start_codon:yes stop_codon:yes gene_type:complete